MLKKTMTALFVSSLFCATSASALTAKQNVEREVIVTKADGTQSVKRELADMVVPGERIVYSIAYHNDKAQPAEDIVLVMPVPEEVEYLERSASNEVATTEFSVDGKAYYSRKNLIVRTDSGTRPAKAKDITHIRWTVNQVIEPGASGQLEFKGRLK